MKLRNPDSRFLRLWMKAMTGEAALLQSRRDGGGAFPVEAEKRKSRVDAGGVMRRYLLTLRSTRGMRAEQWGESHPREAARRSDVCQ
jgi:hypothetical protein